MRVDQQGQDFNISHEMLIHLFQDGFVPGFLSICLLNSDSHLKESTAPVLRMNFALRDVDLSLAMSPSQLFPLRSCLIWQTVATKIGKPHPTQN